MKYIYDILLNYNERLYEFYEWEDNDYFDYVKKIEVIKVSKDTIKDIIKNQIMIDSELVKQLHNTCEVYTNRSVKNVEYACLFCSNSTVVAVEFNYKGISIMKSDLLIEEALDIIEIMKKVKPVDIKYQILNKSEFSLTTRSEEQKLNFMKREISNIYKNNDFDKLKYIYYECFNKEENSLVDMYNNLMNYIISLPTNLYEILMIYQNGLKNNNI